MSRRNINSLVYFVENYKIIPQRAAICTLFSFVHYKKYKPFMNHISVLILIVHFDIKPPVKTIMNIPDRRCHLFARKKNHGMGRKKDIFHDNWYFFIILGNVSLFFYTRDFYFWTPSCFLFIILASGLPLRDVFWRAELWARHKTG